jgi:hypothetical protein
MGEYVPHLELDYYIVQFENDDKPFWKPQFHVWGGGFGICAFGVVCG